MKQTNRYLDEFDSRDKSGLLVKGVSTKPANLNLNSWTHMVEEESRFLQVVLWPSHMCYEHVPLLPTYIHSINK